MLIGIHGKAQAGKDTTSSIILHNLYEAYGLDSIRKYSFADPIKEACNLIFGWDERHSDGPLKEVVDPFWGISPRYAYQTLGTEWGRENIRQDIWIRRAQMYLDKLEHLVVPDVRFENELEWIRKNNGILIVVKRGDKDTILLNGHVSEVGIGHLLDGSEITIHNNGTLAELTAHIVNVVIPRILKESEKKNV